MQLIIKILLILLFISVLIGIYLLVYYLNHKTSYPKGITKEDIEKINKCESCTNTSCKTRISNESNNIECEKIKNEK